MKFLEDIKSIKARIFLNQDIDDNEIFSIAINAKNRSDQRSFDDAMQLLSKPLSKQSNILLLELFRISINDNDSKLAHRLLKTLLRKTNQSFVIHTVLNSKNFTLRKKLIESIKDNKKLQPKNKIYLFFMLWQMKRIPRKLLLQEIKLDLDKILIEYQFDINIDLPDDAWDKNYQWTQVQNKFLLDLMSRTIFLVKIGCGVKAVSFFKRGFSLFKSSNPDNFQDYFNNNNMGWIRLNKERRFSDGICNFDDITKHLDTDFEAFFDTPFNQNELKINEFKSTNALNFATEFAKYSTNCNILKIMFPIHVSKKLRHKNLHEYIPLIQRVNEKDFNKSWAKKINNYFFKDKNYSSEVAFLGLSREIRKKNNIDENKIKDNFSNKVLDGKLNGLIEFCIFSKRDISSNSCNNSVAFKTIYDIADNSIRDWLEDLFIVKLLTVDDRRFRNYYMDHKKIESFKKMFDPKISKIFAENINKKLLRLYEQGLISSNVFLKHKSITSACNFLKQARKTGALKDGVDFLKAVQRFPSTKISLNYSSGYRSTIVTESKLPDYFSSKEFRIEFNKFIQSFLKLGKKNKYWSRNIGLSLNKLILPFCDKKTYKEFLKQNPYCMFTLKTPAESIVEKIRIKKAKNELSKLSDLEFQGEYKKYVTEQIGKDGCGKANSFDLNVLIPHFLEEAQIRSSFPKVKKRFLADLSNWSCKGQQLHMIESIRRGTRHWNAFYYKISPGVTKLLKEVESDITDEIKNMSCEELSNCYDRDQIARLIRFGDSDLNAFLFSQLPHKTIYGLIDRGKIFNGFRKLEAGLDLISVKKALKNACRDAISSKDFSLEKAHFVREIFLHVAHNSYYWGTFTDFNKGCASILRDSSRPIYLQMHKNCIKTLNNLSFKNKEQADSFRNYLSTITVIQGKEHQLCISNFRKIHRSLIPQIEKAARNILEKNDIDKLVGETFLDAIDDLLYNRKGYINNFCPQKKQKNFKMLLKECAMHIMKIRKIAITDRYLVCDELRQEIVENSLKSMKEFDEEFKIMLNTVPISKDFLSTVRNYNAPYWASTLNIFM